MLHFPLQLAIAALVIVLGVDRQVFLSASALALFFAVLIVVSYASHRFLEIPAQRALRKEALSARAGERREAVS